MIMIGGVSLLVIIVIVVGLYAMKHKKKIETKPMIVNTTRGPIVVPATTPISTMPIVTKAPKTYLLSDTGYYLILNNNSPISSTKNVAEATPVKLVPVTVGKFNYSAILTEDGKYICNSNTPGISGGRQIVYRDTLQLSTDSVSAASLLIAPVSGINAIVALWSTNGTTILDKGTTEALIDYTTDNMFFYSFGGPETADAITKFKIHSWSPVNV
jgi:hypothetical protein